MCGSFSLTPALSRWEREDFSPSVAKPKAVDVARDLMPPTAARSRFSLPAGEGWGEGESSKLSGALSQQSLRNPKSLLAVRVQWSHDEIAEKARPSAYEVFNAID